MSFELEPTVRWSQLDSLTLLGGETFELPSGEIQNHLGQDTDGNLILYYRALSPELELQESLTRAILKDLEPGRCTIAESPAGYMMQLAGLVEQTRSERRSEGWTNLTETVENMTFHSSDRRFLEEVRRQLIGRELAAQLQAAELAQSKLVEEFSSLDPSEHEAAGAAMASSALREAMKLLEPEDEQDEMAAKIMGGLLSGIEKMVQGLEKKAESGGLSEESAQALGDLMKDMISED